MPVGGGPVDSGDGLDVYDQFHQPPALAGTYPVTIGPDVLDAAGNVMNQNHDYQNGDGYSGSFEIAAVAVVPDYVQDFDSGDFGTLGGWSFSVDSGAGFAVEVVHGDGRHALPEATLASGYYDRYARAEFVAGSFGLGSSECADAGLPGLAEHSDTSTWYDLHVSGDGADWTSVLAMFVPAAEHDGTPRGGPGGGFEQCGDRGRRGRVRPHGDSAWMMPGQELGLDRVRVGSQDGMGAAVSSMTPITDAQDRVTGLR